jgi:hypothetical protein
VSMHFEGDAHVPLLFLSMSAKALDHPDRKGYECERCHALVREGDWPWCRGRQDDHVRE